MARPERFELPTSGFVGRRSIQLNYGRTLFESVTYVPSRPWTSANRATVAALFYRNAPR